MTFTQEGVYCIFFCLLALRSQDQEREKKEREGNKRNGRVIIGRHSDAIWRSFWYHLADFWQVTDHKKTRYDVVVFCWVILALGDSCGCKSIGHCFCCHCCCRSCYCHRCSCVVAVVVVFCVLEREWNKSDCRQPIFATFAPFLLRWEETFADSPLPFSAYSSFVISISWTLLCKLRKSAHTRSVFTDIWGSGLLFNTAQSTDLFR